MKRRFVLCKYASKLGKGQPGYNFFSGLVKACLSLLQDNFTYFTLHSHAIRKTSWICWKLFGIRFPVTTHTWCICWL